MHECTSARVQPYVLMRPDPASRVVVGGSDVKQAWESKLSAVSTYETRIDHILSCTYTGGIEIVKANNYHPERINQSPGRFAMKALYKARQLKARAISIKSRGNSLDL